MTGSTKSVSILGCGRTGTAIGRELAQAGFHVSGSTTTVARFDSLKAEGICPVELRLDGSFFESAGRFFNTDILIVTLPPSSPKEGERSLTYIEQLQAISRAAAEGGVQQLIFTGATFIYPSNNGEVREDDVEPGNSSFMGLDWREVEQAVASSMPERTTILRLTGLMGEGHNAGTYFSGQPMAGANDPVNMVHQDDVAGVVHEIIRHNIVGEVFNVSAPQHPTRRAFYTQACEVAGIALPQFSDEPKPYRLVNCDKLTERLDYTFRYPDPVAAIG